MEHPIQNEPSIQEEKLPIDKISLESLPQAMKGTIKMTFDFNSKSDVNQTSTNVLSAEDYQYLLYCKNNLLYTRLKEKLFQLYQLSGEPIKFHSFNWRNAIDLRNLDDQSLESTVFIKTFSALIERSQFSRGMALCTNITLYDTSWPGVDRRCTLCWKINIDFPKFPLNEFSETQILFLITRNYRNDVGGGESITSQLTKYSEIFGKEIYVTHAMDNYADWYQIRLFCLGLEQDLKFSCSCCFVFRSDKLSEWLDLLKNENSYLVGYRLR